MKSGDVIRDYIENAERVLRAARAEYLQQSPDTAVLFVRAAIRNLNLAANRLDDSAQVIPMARERDGNRRLPA